MSVIATNPVNNYQNWTMPQQIQQGQTSQPAVAISTPQGRQVYQYPQTSIYNDSSKTPASGLNIFVFNPSGISNPEAVNNTVCTLGGAQTQAPNTNQPNIKQANPIANTSLKEEKTETAQKTKKKNVVKLTDDYIKTLESFLRSKDVSVRKQGVQDLVKRFDEDDSRYDNESLTALLNIALQDSDVHNRLIALSAVTSGCAHGDANTIELVKGLTASDKLYGQEAKMATNALLKTSQTKEKIDVADTESAENDDEKNKNDEIR